MISGLLLLAALASTDQRPLKAYDPGLYAILEQVYAGHHIPADIYYGRNIKPTPRRHL